jgi:hypothetical protein
LIRDADNAFLQARVKLALIEEMLATDTGLHVGRETGVPFFCDALVKF